MTTNSKNPSSFALAALALDGDFQRFERLADELERLPLETDRGMERAQELIKELTACRERFTPSTQQLAQALEDVRDRAAKAAESVAIREQAVHDRHAAVEVVLARYRALADMVQKVSVAVGTMRPAGGGLSSEEKSALTERLPELNSQLGILVDEARKLMDEARALKLKVLERNADSLRQSLHSTRNKFSQMADHTGP